ncbi:NAD(+) diphosphatase [Salinimonas chungwhensis]|uniref:NAD(+) diphosphatase n=1 Tax=Salinimonas chungwhensis TaxID=265425 RepID=UPI00036D35C9|nr:NAD(+) diphosphatase [Salinimonas chungwhensis]
MMNKLTREALLNYRGPWLVFCRDQVLVDEKGALPDSSWASLHFLHHYADQVQALPPLEQTASPPPALNILDIGSERLNAPGWQWTSLRHILTGATAIEFKEYSRAWQYIHFLRTHQFCGQCGARTEKIGWEMAVQCRQCQHRTYPRVSPSIIVAIYRGEEILLARGVGHRDPQMYSTLAGFVESGETLEQALHREVYEEVGIKIKNEEYYESQPWPFPHSLMVGYFAEYDSGEINIDKREIVDAHWFNIHDLPKIPPTLSIAGRLIRDIVARLKK